MVFESGGGGGGCGGRSEPELIVIMLLEQTRQGARLFEITITVLANWFINGPPDPPADTLMSI